MVDRMRIGNRDFEINKHTYVMGILNVTPDSFSDGGKYNCINRAVEHAVEMIEAGADIIDVGGESTRPGHVLITEEEEIERVVPVISALKSQFDIPISIDTYKSKVALAAIEAGVDLINDIWGLKYDNKMAEVIAESGLCCCLMHNRNKAEYRDFMEEVESDLMETLAIARRAGIASEKIILDPGVGFGKTYENNLEIINRLEELLRLDCPLLLGTSRKSVIGKTLNLDSNERVEGTIATTVLGVSSGCSFVRVHDIRENVRAIQMTEAIKGAGTGRKNREENKNVG